MGLISLLAIPVVGCQKPPTIAFNSSSFSFNAIHGETELLTDTLHISNSGGGTLTWSVSSDVDNITLSPSRDGSAGEPNEVNISVDISGFSVGSYETTITIFAASASNTPQTVPVKITITKNPRYVYENGDIHVGGDGQPIELINNPSATNPSYDELVAFIKADTTDTKGLEETQQSNVLLRRPRIILSLNPDQVVYYSMNSTYIIL